MSFNFLADLLGAWTELYDNDNFLLMKRQQARALTDLLLFATRPLALSKNTSQKYKTYKEYLDEQFIQLEELQDDANPNFVEETVTLFYSTSAKLIQNIEQALTRKPIDFTRLDDYIHRFKGSCSSIGAKKVRNECIPFSKYCSEENAEGCIRVFQQIKQEYAILKRKLETYFQMVRQAGI